MQFLKRCRSSAVARCKDGCCSRGEVQPSLLERSSNLTFAYYGDLTPFFFAKIYCVPISFEL